PGEYSMTARTGLTFTGLLLAATFASAADSNLIDAVRRSDLPTVRALAKQHANIDQRSGDGSTALHWAAHLDNGDAVDLLLASGADVNAVNDLGVTPLFASIPNGDVRLVRRLLAA